MSTDNKDWMSDKKYDFHTRHFSLREFLRSSTADRLEIENIPGPQDLFNLKHLCSVLDGIWEGFYETLPEEEKEGFFIRINSGYRCPELNQAVGGVERSWHKSGQAADLNLGSREKNRRLFEWLADKKNAKKHVYDLILNESDYAWIHIQVSFSTERNRRMVIR